MGRKLPLPPRRIAATSLAERVGEEMDVSVGDEVGYSIRFEDCTFKNTLLKYMNDGMLLRKAMVNPLFSLHERRTLATDLLMKERPDLKLIVMSATMDSAKFQGFFQKASLLLIPGRDFPVDVDCTSEPVADYVEASVEMACDIHCREERRDILLTPGGTRGRKCIVATNIAEKSLTIDGVAYVVDPGFAKQAVHNPRIRLESVLVAPISKASAQQRAGRAGRTRPGKSPETLIRAFELVLRLGAIDDDTRLTRLGELTAELPTDPQLAKSLIKSPQKRCSNEVLSIVAMLSSPKMLRSRADEAKRDSTMKMGDHLTLLNIFNAFAENAGDSSWCFRNFLNARSLKMAESARRQLAEIMRMCEIPLISTDWRAEMFVMQAAEVKRAGHYKTLDDQCAFFHPSCCLSRKSEWVIYSEFVLTERWFIRTVTEVRKEWLSTTLSTTISTPSEHRVEEGV
ncbi:hypothetical protein DFJ73DRAFT_790048 [Zopfochytrium polystomum]|nr:hypothetical protein DFJ73DRAFT_790048 [Zopfochytrium polystomum]